MMASSKHVRYSDDSDYRFFCLGNRYLARASLQIPSKHNGTKQAYQGSLHRPHLPHCATVFEVHPHSRCRLEPYPSVRRDCQRQSSNLTIVRRSHHVVFYNVVIKTRLWSAGKTRIPRDPRLPFQCIPCQFASNVFTGQRLASEASTAGKGCAGRPGSSQESLRTHIAEVREHLLSEDLDERSIVRA